MPVLFSSTQGCRDIVGVEARQTLQAPSCDDLAGAGDSCTACLRGGCCDEMAACAADAPCAKTFSCMNGCPPGDEICRADCVSGWGPPLAKLLACRANRCEIDCNSTCGDAIGVLVPDVIKGAPDCASCLQKKVCVEATTCANDAACLQYLGCNFRVCNPNDYACLMRCGVQFDAAAKAALAVQSKAASSCSAECRLNTNWDCAGKRSWPYSIESKSMAISQRIQDLVSGKRLAGAAVKACGNGDPGCSMPVSTTTTDDHGLFSMTVYSNAPGSIFNGYFEVTGAGVYPSLLVIFPSIVGDMPATADTFVYSLIPSAVTVEAVAKEVLEIAIEPDRGLLFVTMIDCLSFLGTGVQLEVSSADDRTTTTYLLDGIPSKEPQQAVEGLAVVWNVPPGKAEIVGKLASTGEVVGRVTVPVRAGYMTNFSLVPRPFVP